MNKMKIQNKNFGILMISFIAVLASAYPLYREINHIEKHIQKSEALLFTKNENLTRISQKLSTKYGRDSKRLPIAPEHSLEDNRTSENKDRISDRSEVQGVCEKSELAAANQSQSTDEEADYQIFYPKNLPNKTLPNERAPEDQIPTSPWPANLPPVETVPSNSIPNNPLPKNRIDPVRNMPKGRIPNNRIPNNSIPNNRIPNQ